MASLYVIESSCSCELYWTTWCTRWRWKSLEWKSEGWQRSSVEIAGYMSHLVNLNVLNIYFSYTCGRYANFKNVEQNLTYVEAKTSCQWDKTWSKDPLDPCSCKSTMNHRIESPSSSKLYCRDPLPNSSWTTTRPQLHICTRERISVDFASE